MSWQRRKAVTATSQKRGLEGAQHSSQDRHPGPMALSDEQRVAIKDKVDGPWWLRRQRRRARRVRDAQGTAPSAERPGEDRRRQRFQISLPSECCVEGLKPPGHP
jgi:hypothetical protein